MRLALCDDNQNEICILHQYVAEFCQKHDIDITVDRYSSAEQLLASEKHYDILFMDIYLGGILGTEAAAMSKGSIYDEVVFTTTSKEHAIEAYGMDAAHYIVKPISQGDVFEAMERCLKRSNIAVDRIIVIKSGTDGVPVRISDINYIEVFNKVSTVHTNNGSLNTFSSLEMLMEQLRDERFIKAQRSFIVNMDYIQSFYYDHIVLKNDVQIMLSRANRAEQKKQYQSYLFKQARRSGK